MTDYCCTPDSGDCCGPGSWCCGRAGKHDHEETRMTTNHIDQLTEWWESAEKVAPERGDLVIEDVSDEDGPDFRVRKWPGAMRQKLSYARVLERAPKPKPAWHDAVAVIAAADVGDGVWVTGVWTQEGVENYWESTEGYVMRADALRDVTPLIEAKVTDEMVKRASIAFWAFDGDADESMPAALHAALGLDAD